MRFFGQIADDFPDHFEAFQREQYDPATPLGAYYGKGHASLHLLFDNGYQVCGIGSRHLAQREQQGSRIARPSFFSEMVLHFTNRGCQLFALLYCSFKRGKVACPRRVSEDAAASA